METVLQTNWGWQIAMDLFLGGLGAGCFLIAAIIYLSTKERFIKIVKFGAWASVLSLIGAVSVLLLEVGIPQRAILLYNSFVNFDSWMPVGAWLLFSGIIIYGLYALSLTDLITNKFRFLLKCRAVLAVIGIVIAIGIVSYTGLLLSAIWAHPLWNTFWLPVLIVTSAFCMGMVFITTYAVLIKDEKIAALQKVFTISSVALIIMTGIALGCYLATISSSSAIALESVEILTSGAVSGLFWYIAVGCGLVIPLIIYLLILIRFDLSKIMGGILPMSAIALILVGALTLRLAILMAGLPVYA
jgi:formate-dependent nitrite reductase membrane component NrfD